MDQHGLSGFAHLSTCPGSGKPSVEESERRIADRRHAKHRTAAKVRDDAAVALDAFIECRTEYDAATIAEWSKLALFQYRERWNVPAVHPYRYETREKPWNRRAATRGDIFCRFCGERLFTGVKRPHELVANSAVAQRHLTICALQVLAGVKEPVDPKHKRVPFEDLARPTGDSGPLFGRSS